jgi:3-dehydroquinate synthase
MPTVPLILPHHRYDIHIEAGLLSRLGPLVRSVAPHARAGLYADENVAAVHGPAAQQSLREVGYDVQSLALSSGEDRKNLDTVRRLYDVMVQHKLERRSPVIALGGGVAGDTVGFAAATYLRGVPFVQCPTTLLAMVDASVGGKVGVNLPQGKNLIGAFHQPVLVAIDTATLRTLPTRELRCGLAECVKHGVIRAPDRFAWLEQHLDAVLALDPATLDELVQWNVSIKAQVVMADEKEQGERAHLNFGHTFAHAIEALSGYGHYHHGEAVALGMVAATRLAANAGRCPPAVPDRLMKLLDRIGLPTRADDLPPTDQLLDSMTLDKKVAGGKVRLILPRDFGQVEIVSDTPLTAIAGAWDSLRR